MKNILPLLALIFCVFTFEGHSQEEEPPKDQEEAIKARKFFGTFLLSPFANYTKGKITPSASQSKGYISAFQSMAFMFNYDARFNLVQFGEESALSISLSPTVGAGFSDNADFEWAETGIGQFNLPAFISFEHGAGATYTSLKTNGISLGVGVEYNYAPFVIVDEDDNVNQGEIANKAIKSSVLPVMSLTYKRWSKKGFMFIQRLKYGFLNYSTKIGTGTVDSKLVTFSYSFGFSFS
jgi:hypothetical protein